MGETAAVPLLYLIDALPYVFRAYFALPERLSPRGHPVHAVFLRSAGCDLRDDLVAEIGQ